MMDLQNAHAIITGGTAGIGLALANRLLQAGAKPIVLGRSEERLARAMQAVPGITGFTCDVTAPNAADQIKRYLSDNNTPLRILINNAGLQHASSPHSPPWDLPNGDTQEIAVNVQALTTLSYELLPILAASTQSALVNVSSGLALAPKKSSPIYCATKAYVRSFTRAIRYRIEDAAIDVHVMEALPPLVDTEMTAGRGTGKISPDQCADQIIRALIARKPECYVGKVKLLSTLHRFAPAIAYKAVRNW